MCVCVCVCVCRNIYGRICLFGQHFFINAYFIEEYRQVLSTPFCICPLQYRIDFMVSGGNWLMKLP